MAATGRPKLDTILVSHLHPDHIDGLYDVAAVLPIGLLVDRDYPDYAYPEPQHAPFAKAYIAFVRERVRAGGRVERFPGRGGRPAHPARRPDPQPGRQWRGLDR